MRTLFTLLFFSLLCFSCQEKEPFVVDYFVEPTTPVETTENFLYDTYSFSTNNGYVVTELVDAGEDLYHHHLALTEKNVLVGSDLRGYSDVITFNFVTKGHDIVGVHSIAVNEAEENSAVGLKSYGAHSGLNFSADRPYTTSGNLSGELRIVRSSDGYSYVIEADLIGRRSSEGLSGSYVGRVETLRPTEFSAAEGVDPQGPNEFNFRNFKHDINHAYLVKGDDPAGSSTTGILYLSTNEIIQEGQLSGTSDLFMFRLINASNQIQGQYYSSDGTRYADRVSAFSLSDSYYCRNMNFSTYTADDDVPVSTLVASIEQQGDEILVTFYSEDSSGQRNVSGRYRGPITVVD